MPLFFACALFVELPFIALQSIVSLSKRSPRPKKAGVFFLLAQIVKAYFSFVIFLDDDTRPAARDNPCEYCS